MENTDKIDIQYNLQQSHNSMLSKKSSNEFRILSHNNNIKANCEQLDRVNNYQEKIKNENVSKEIKAIFLRVLLFSILAGTFVFTLGATVYAVSHVAIGMIAGLCIPVALTPIMSAFIIHDYKKTIKCMTNDYEKKDSIQKNIDLGYKKIKLLEEQNMRIDDVLKSIEETLDNIECRTDIDDELKNNCQMIADTVKKLSLERKDYTL